MNLPRKTAIELFRKMLLIRITDERIADIYAQGEMRTPTHFSIGQEAVSAGISAGLTKGDAVFASHRCHAAYLAKGGNLNSMVAELFGRVTGACGGRSGSAHLSSPGHNMYAAPILGGMIPVSVGQALSFSMSKSKKISVAFFGDAAVEEGACTESINFAIIKKLPVLFICENNFFSTHTHIRYRQPAIDIYKRIRGFGIKTRKIDGNNVIDVYKAGINAINKIRKGSGPLFLECGTYRYREHVGPDYDFQNPYRTRKDVEYWMSKCPIKKLEGQLIRSDMMNQQAVDKMRKSIIKQVDNAIQFARTSAWPKTKDLLKYV